MRHDRHTEQCEDTFSHAEGFFPVLSSMVISGFIPAELNPVIWLPAYPRECYSVTQKKKV